MSEIMSMSSMGMVMSVNHIDNISYQHYGLQKSRNIIVVMIHTL